jgi:hypothetical protein
MLLAPRVGPFAAMALAATEFTAKIFPIRIPRMREEANPTTAAADRTACQTRMLAQDGIQRQLILTNKRTDAVVLMPIFGIRKEFPDGYDKNARLSVKILSVVSMSPSYSLDAIAARGRPGIFLWLKAHDRSAAGTTDSSANRLLAARLCPAGHISPRPTNTLPGKKNQEPPSRIPKPAPTTSLPSSGPL